MRFNYPLVASLVVFLSCRQTSFPDHDVFLIQNQSFHGEVVFRSNENKLGFRILLRTPDGEVTDQTLFQYEPYRFDTADVDRDGQTEVLLGLSKATRFDPHIRKRLFILRIDENHLRPLWLGSKVCRELVDFRAVENGTIRTLERTSSGNYAIGKYFWESFGLTLEQYTHNEINYDQARQIFAN
jgi:hypothetical protein